MASTAVTSSNLGPAPMLQSMLLQHGAAGAFALRSRPRNFPLKLQRSSARSIQAKESEADDDVSVTLSRRQSLQLPLGAGLCGAFSSVQPLFPAPAWAYKEVKVGTIFPSAGEEDFVVFQAGLKDTPALRAGNVPPYRFFLPPSWTQQRVANILSGNYCQPKCAEPWIEVKFGDPKAGSLQIVASPLVRLTNQIGATIEEIGPPEDIIAALGPFVTGDSYEPEEVVETSMKEVDGRTYYTYTLETPYARSGAHNLASATAKGEAVLLCVISATDAQWNSSEKTLRKLIDSFRV